MGLPLHKTVRLVFLVEGSHMGLPLHRVDTINGFFFLPFMYGTRTSGIVMLPSSFWKDSIMGMSSLGLATAVLFRVKGKRFCPLPDLYLILNLRA